MEYFTNCVEHVGNRVEYLETMSMSNILGTVSNILGTVSNILGTVSNILETVWNI